MEKKERAGGAGRGGQRMGRNRQAVEAAVSVFTMRGARPLKVTQSGAAELAVCWEMANRLAR